MKIDLELAKNIIQAFLADREAMKAIRRRISEPQMATAFSIKDQMPIFESTEFVPAAAQALGLAWVCLATGHARCMTRLEIFHELPRPSLKKTQENDPFKPNHWLTVLTFYGKGEKHIIDILLDCDRMR